MAVTTRLYGTNIPTAAQVDKWVGGSVTIGIPSGGAFVPVTFDDALVAAEDVDARMLELGYQFRAVQTGTNPTRTWDYGSRSGAPPAPAPSIGSVYYDTVLAVKLVWSGIAWVPI
jgi:hypothetical protein